MEPMKGQDILVLLERAEPAAPDWTHAGLAGALGMSASEVHAAIRRCEAAGLYNPRTRRPRLDALHELLVHGIRCVFPAPPGPVVRGRPTGPAAPPLGGALGFDAGEIPAMPLADGPARGPSIAPLYRSAPDAAARDEALYELLALVDALRAGRARERRMAAEHLGRRLLA